MATFSPLQLIESVEFHSNYSPDVAVDVNGPSDPRTTQAAIAALKSLQPMFKIKFVQGIADPLIIAPYGQPGPSKWPALKLGAQVVGMASAGFAIYSLISIILPRKK